LARERENCGSGVEYAPAVAPESEPESEAELLARAEDLAGMSLAELAARFDLRTPPDLRRAKGFAGQLLERALGATAASRAQPDFGRLGIELKSLPVDQRGRPCESTFVCTIALTAVGDLEWEQSLVRRKLARVLWIPVQGDRSLAVSSRRIGTPLLWSPDADEEALLRFDWDELSGLIGRGDVERITGHLGRCLQIRPKARDSRARRTATDASGAAFAALPRGFYLRASFTARVLEKHFGPAADSPPFRR
jgi:DNA mismatch repair protein MutH